MRRAISFQLYSTRRAVDTASVLAELAAIGYDAVEPWPANYSDDPAGFRAMLDSEGLRCLGFHLPFREVVSDPSRYVDVALTLGEAPLMIVPTIVPEDRPFNADGWRRIGGALAGVAASIQDHGLRLAWHNHDYEFKRLPTGERPIDLLLDAAGERVGFEVDLAWMTRAWVDPLVEFERRASRVLAIQVKDTAPPGTTFEEGWSAPGDGIVDWDRLWPSFAMAPADHYVVEHDAPDDWRRTARRAFDFLAARGAGLSLGPQS